MGCVGHGGGAGTGGAGGATTTAGGGGAGRGTARNSGAVTTALAGVGVGAATGVGGAAGFSGAAGAHCDGSTAGPGAGAGRGGVATAGGGAGLGGADRQPRSSARAPVAATSIPTIHIRYMPTSLPESKRPIRSGVSRGSGSVGLFRRFGRAVRKVSRIHLSRTVAPALTGPRPLPNLTTHHPDSAGAPRCRRATPSATVGDIFPPGVLWGFPCPSSFNVRSAERSCAGRTSWPGNRCGARGAGRSSAFPVPKAVSTA